MIYLDTSVVLLILLEQEGASSAKAFFERLEPAERVLSSILLRIEVSRALHREGLPLDIAEEFFDGVEAVDIHDAVVERACALTGELKSLDAIHLATVRAIPSPSSPTTPAWPPRPALVTSPSSIPSPPEGGGDDSGERGCGADGTHPHPAGARHGCGARTGRPA